MRQLWWGHRIPVWYVGGWDEEYIVARDEAEARTRAAKASLVTGVTPGQDIPLNMDKIAANKAFTNKLWNCCKFVKDKALKDIGEDEMEALGVAGPMGREEFDKLALPERYIVLRCHELVESVMSDIENYQLGAVRSKVSAKCKANARIVRECLCLRRGTCQRQGIMARGRVGAAAANALLIWK